jgi:hypothetical protein
MMKFFIGLISMLGDVAVKLADIEEENKEIPEIINITPLNRLSSAERLGGTANKNGTINIELWLSPDLQARVINDTMNQISDIMVNIQRRR